jgi:membrane protein
MIWMWLSTILILLGGEFNAEMERQTTKDTMIGARKPMGRSGVADAVDRAHKG